MNLQSWKIKVIDDDNLKEELYQNAWARILKLPENIVPTVLITLGYALEEPSPKMRFLKEEIML